MSGTGLLTYASPWNNESSNRSNNTVRKRQSTLSNPSIRNNKTIKKNPVNNEDAEEYPVDKENFQSLTPATLDDSKSRSNKIQEIINNVGSVKTEDDGTSLANFNMNSSSENQPIKPIAPFYATNDSSSYHLGNYKDIYNHSSRIGEFPYAKPSTTNASVAPLIQDKITEKINYMIHLLEEQQKEPTKHITEEFILYTFLGIFVIYIVDSFARVGKYIR